MTLLRWATLSILTCLTCSASRALAANTDFDVKFDQCSEYVGIGFVPAARARALVPAKYTLAGDATNAVVVVRVTRCAAVTLDGGNAKPAHTAQIGIKITGPNATADIDNYLLWYVTDLGELEAKMQAAGVACGNDQQLSFDFTPAASPTPLAIDVDAAQFPAYRLQGQAAASSAAPVPFVANWWSDGSKGTLRMHTEFPQIRFGSASVTLTTPAGSALAMLIGAQTIQFPLLDSYNEFGAVVMQVRKQ
jgi:hypothetical protein